MNDQPALFAVFAIVTLITIIIIITKSIRKNHFTDPSIMSEIESDLIDGCMPTGEVESCLNHWRNKYLIVRRDRS